MHNLSCRRTKASSHKTLYEYITSTELNKLQLTVKKRYRKSIFSYKFINQVPIRDGDDSLLVNWLEVTEIDKKTGKKLYHNTFITNHHITTENIYEIGCAGRARWRLENENNNTLKTKGYRFEHNYGHGHNNLSTVLASLTIVAFLYHTVMKIVDILYLRARDKEGTLYAFFRTIKTLTCFFVFKSWYSLMKFIADPPDTLATSGQY